MKHKCIFKFSLMAILSFLVATPTLGWAICSIPYNPDPTGSCHVANNEDNGDDKNPPGNSLRQLVVAACQNSGNDTIDFKPYIYRYIFLKAPLIIPPTCKGTIEIIGDFLAQGNTDPNDRMILDGSNFPVSGNPCILDIQSTLNNIHNLYFTGSPGAGICVHGDNNLIHDNIIGYRPDHPMYGPNKVGIELSHSFNEIYSNTIGRNNGPGIHIVGSFTMTDVSTVTTYASFNKIYRNVIGTSLPALTEDLYNSGGGILIDSHSAFNMIGKGAGNIYSNVIKFNKGNGVVLVGTDNYANSIVFNSISENIGLGIDIDNDGVDTSSNPNKPNRGILPPALTNTTLSGTTWFVTGTGVEGAEVEIFKAGTSGNGQGSFILGWGVVQKGSFSIQLTPTGLQLQEGDWITATQTASLQGTSEFSKNVTLVNTPVTSCASFGGDTDGDGVCDVIDNCPSVSNADQYDADKDGVGSVCDNCPSIYNADQETVHPAVNGICNGDNVPTNWKAENFTVYVELDNSNPAIAHLSFTSLTNPDAQRYEINRTTDGVTWTKVGDSFTSSMDDKGLSPKTTYFYQVKAFVADKKVPLYEYSLESDFSIPITTPTCGDSSLGAGEACDDGNTNADDGCSADCKTIEPNYKCPTPGSSCEKINVSNPCGNGVVDAGEACDTGGDLDRGGCMSGCTVEVGWECTHDLGQISVCNLQCGNGKVEAGEGCDMGVNGIGHGCSAECKPETNFTCTQQVGKVSVCTPTSVQSACGDGIVGGTEECDNGKPSQDADGCTKACHPMGGFQCSVDPTMHSACSTIPAACGDGFVGAGESCDDQNTTKGDGCSEACQTEAGYYCNGTPNVCVPISGACGNGRLDAGEMCEDGNQKSGDGCVADCSKIEPGYDCSTPGQACKTITPKDCGNGAVQSDLGEVCDDGNTGNGDGCSSFCKLEPNSSCSPGSPSICTTTLAGVPAAPSLLTAKVNGTTSITLTFTDNADNEDGFNIERASGACTQAVSFVTAKSLRALSDKGSAASLTDDTVEAERSYCYRVKAYNSKGNSNPSNLTTVTVPKVDTGEDPKKPVAVESGGCSIGMATGATSFFGAWMLILPMVGVGWRRRRGEERF